MITLPQQGARTDETSAQPERISDRCKALEKSIAESASAIIDLRGKLGSAQTPEQLAKMHSEVEFGELHRNRLIDERMTLEEDRLAEALGDISSEQQHADPLPDLLQQRKVLERQISQVEDAIASATAVSRRLATRQNVARMALSTFSSKRDVDQPSRREMVNELRNRLEALGH